MINPLRSEAEAFRFLLYVLVVAAVIGGLGGIGGAAAGSVLVVVLPWLVDTLADSLPDELGLRLNGNLAVLLFGLVVITVTAFRPGGLAQLMPIRNTKR